MSKGEYASVKTAVGGISALIDTQCDAYEKLYIKYLAGEAAAEEKLLDNPALFKTPIVRNGREATVGHRPEVWAKWQ
jgi:arsenate reductase-like glutaredoxin family protein